MTGVIHLEIDVGNLPTLQNPLVSEETVVGGLKWQLTAFMEMSERTRHVRTMLLALSCKNADAREYWRCEHRCTATIINPDANNNKNGEYLKSFSTDLCSWAISVPPNDWDDVLDSSKGFISDGKARVELNIKIVKTCGVSDNGGRDFAQSDDMSDVALLVGGEKVHVSKMLLGVHSPVFKAMLFGKFQEAGKAEVEIQEVDHKEFVEFLNVIYTSVYEITDRNVESILLLADRFQVKFVLDAAESFLMHSSKLRVTKKLSLTDNYKLALLQAFTLRSIAKLSDIKAFEFDPLYHDFSSDLKGKISDRTIELIPGNDEQ